MNQRLKRSIGVLLVAAVLSAVPSPVAASANDDLLEALEGSEYAGATGRQGSVLRLYTSIFRRLPDADGFDFWVNENDWDLRRVAAFFASSPEFVETYGALDDEAFVRLMYVNVLGRDGEPGGVEFWIGIAGTVGRAEVVIGFSESLEYIEATSEEAAEPDVDEATDTNDDHSHDGDEDHSHEEVTDLSGIDLLGEYSVEIPEYGTLVTVTIDEEASTRTITSNALPDHETGEFPNEANPNTISAQDESYTFPLVPEYVGQPTQAQIPAIVFNGVKFEPGTAELAVCDNGITYNIQAVGLADLVDIPQGLDFNNAHVQPWGEYHYHGTPESVVDNAVAMSGSDEDLVFLGFAADGHLIYHSQSEAYSSSYQLGTDEREGTNCVHEARSDAEEAVFFGPEKDGSLSQDWDFDESYGDLDECNGIEIDGEYLYLVTDTYPYVPRCVMGSYEAPARDNGETEGPGDQGGRGGGEAPADGDRPERPAPGED